MRRKDEIHWCHYCRSVIRNDATASITLKGTKRPWFFFHMPCYHEWWGKGNPMLPGAMAATAKRLRRT